ncbi:MAG: polymerase, sigma-24 subunit, subfamily, partial [Verrucomicrobiales bacterium]|nr:polymerase, sigma-24 subunit, subfamily [Verrucomicrobiales bacterium]
MENNEPDGILLKRYVTQRDEAAFTQLVQRHIAVVFATAFRKLNDSTGAEEATQNVFITLARRAPWLCGHPSLVGWLHRATLHFSHHQLRANQRRRNREQLAFELGTSMNINDANTSELASVLDDALLELRESDREAILLRFFANHSLRQMGTVLGIRENSAQKRVAKALDHLAQLFRRKGYKVSGAAALAIALQHMPANAVPAALLSTTAKTALAAGTATSFGGITVYIAKIMSLTKVQTAVICLTLATVPLS